MIVCCVLLLFIADCLGRPCGDTLFQFEFYIGFECEQAWELLQSLFIYTSNVEVITLHLP